MKRADKRTITVIMVAVILIAVIPLFILKGAEFGGSDDAGSQVVESIDNDLHSDRHRRWDYCFFAGAVCGTEKMGKEVAPIWQLDFLKGKKPHQVNWRGF